MPQTRARKTGDKLQRCPKDVKSKEQKETMDTILRSVDILIAMTENTAMGTATRILYTAKEELVHWAVTMNFHENEQDRFINQRLYDHRLSVMESLVMRAIKGTKTHAEITDLLDLHPTK